MNEHRSAEHDRSPIEGATPPAAFGAPDSSQPEPGPDPSAGGTDLPGDAQADLTGEEQESRLENQPPPQAMQVPREDADE